MSAVTDCKEVRTRYCFEMLALMIYVKILHERAHVESQQEPMVNLPPAVARRLY